MDDIKNFHRMPRDEELAVDQRLGMFMCIVSAIGMICLGIWAFFGGC